MKMMGQSLFVYGTLMAPEVMKALLGYLPSHELAVLVGFRRHPVLSQVFPGIIAIASTAFSSSQLQGVLYRDLQHRDMKRLDWFEGDEYIRNDVNVMTRHGLETTTQTYVWANPITELDVTLEWSYDFFREQHLEMYLRHTVGPCREELDKMEA